jgi:AcrR family transcriptional regulator
MVAKTPRPVGRPRGDVEAQRTAVFEAALDLFSAESFAAVPATRLIEASGVSSGSFYRLFGDKEGVLHELLTAAHERNRLEIEIHLTDDPDPVRRLADYVEVCVEVSRHALAGWLPRIRRIMAGGLPPALAAFPERADALTRLGVAAMLDDIAAAGRLRPGVDTTAAAGIVTGILDRAVLDGEPSGHAVSDFVVNALVREATP